MASTNAPNLQDNDRYPSTNPSIDMAMDSERRPFQETTSTHYDMQETSGNEHDVAHLAETLAISPSLINGNGESAGENRHERHGPGAEYNPQTPRTRRWSPSNADTPIPSIERNQGLALVRRMDLEDMEYRIRKYIDELHDESDSREKELKKRITELEDSVESERCKCDSNSLLSHTFAGRMLGTTERGPVAASGYPVVSDALSDARRRYMEDLRMRMRLDGAENSAEEEQDPLTRVQRVTSNTQIAPTNMNSSSLSNNTDGSSGGLLFGEASNTLEGRDLPMNPPPMLGSPSNMPQDNMPATIGQLASMEVVVGFLELDIRALRMDVEKLRAGRCMCAEDTEWQGRGEMGVRSNKTGDNASDWEVDEQFYDAEDAINGTRGECEGEGRDGVNENKLFHGKLTDKETDQGSLPRLESRVQASLKNNAITAPQLPAINSQHINGASGFSLMQFLHTGRIIEEASDVEALEKDKEVTLPTMREDEEYFDACPPTKEDEKDRFQG